MTPGRLRWILAGGIVLISAIVTAAAFTSIPHSGGDNAGYVALAHSLVTDAAYVDAFDPERMKHTKYPPVFPALLAVMIALGARTWATLKLAAAVPTVLAVGATYLWAERRIGPVAAFGVALLLTLSSGIVYYSHWVLSDPLFLACSMTSLAAFAMIGHDSDADDSGSRSWLVLGLVAAGLAYFTRSAGLPLVLAVLMWLGLERRWRTLGVSAGALGVPMALWWLRGRGEGVAQYGAEFWMVNPYEPAAGTIGVFGLFPRMLENGSAYLFQHGPAGIVGADGPALGAIGVAIACIALLGWVLSVRERIGVAELFLPLYTGLILVWPAVWGGDRFALPLYPLVFLYGAVAIRALAARLPQGVRPAVGAVAVLLLAAPAAGNWLDGNRQNGACDAVAAERGAWACYGPRIGHFVAAASWMGENLPEDAAVLSRKPRHFYLLSGRPSRTFPFVGEAEAHLTLADDVGARYVLLDQWDGLAARNVGSALRERPGAFCYIRGFGEPGAGGSQLLGILPPGQRRTTEPAEGGSVGIASCGAGYVLPGAETGADYSSSGRIPLLETLDS